MKLTGVILDCFLPREETDTFADGVLTVTWEPDEMNSTAVVINGQYYSEGTISLKVGDAIRLEIPSGFWEGKVMEINPPGIYSFSYLIRVMDVVWEGKYAGLARGLSGLLTWDLFWPDDGTVETSAYPAPVPYHVYRAAHAAVDAGPDGFYGQPEARRRALGQILEVIMSWRGA